MRNGNEQKKKKENSFSPTGPATSLLAQFPATGPFLLPHSSISPRSCALTPGAGGQFVGVRRINDLWDPLVRLIPFLNNPLGARDFRSSVNHGVIPARTSYPRRIRTDFAGLWPPKLSAPPSRQSLAAKQTWPPLPRARHGQISRRTRRLLQPSHRSWWPLPYIIRQLYQLEASSPGMLVVRNRRRWGCSAVEHRWLWRCSGGESEFGPFVDLRGSDLRYWLDWEDPGARWISHRKTDFCRGPWCIVREGLCHASSGKDDPFRSAMIFCPFCAYSHMDWGTGVADASPRRRAMPCWVARLLPPWSLGWRVGTMDYDRWFGRDRPRSSHGITIKRSESRPSDLDWSGEIWS
jgi:hypothetical protein